MVFIPKNKIVVRGQVLTAGDLISVRCAIGKTGYTNHKSEGDLATPIGCFPIRGVFFRADRLPKPNTHLPVIAIQQHDGWCDDPEDADYNRLIRLPHNARHERLWRDDHVYDICVILGFNDDPPVANRGSAIFFHLSRDGYQPTEGCVAVSLVDMGRILGICRSDTEFEILGP